MLTGTRKAADHPNAAEIGAYFSSMDAAKIAASYQGAFEVSEVMGAGHALLKTHTEEAASIAWPFIERHLR